MRQLGHAPKFCLANQIIEREPLTNDLPHNCVESPAIVQTLRGDCNGMFARVSSEKMKAPEQISRFAPAIPRLLALQLKRIFYPSTHPAGTPSTAEN